VLPNYGKIRYGVRNGAMLALPVHLWPQKGLSTPKPPIFAPQCAPPMCWHHTMLPWTTLRLGWGCISSGEGPSSGLLGNSKLDAVLDFWLLIYVLFILNGCKKKCLKIGVKRPNYGQIVQVRWHYTVLSDTVFSNWPYLHRNLWRITVLYHKYSQESRSTAYLDKPGPDT
jgi:hypothetical protein